MHVEPHIIRLRMISHETRRSIADHCIQQQDLVVCPCFVVFGLKEKV